MRKFKIWYRKWFKKKVIVYSSTHAPAEFVKHVTKRSTGKRYVRVKFTNRQKYTGHIPVTDIDYENVVYIRVFTWHWYRRLCELAQWKVPEQIIWYNKAKTAKA